MLILTLIIVLIFLSGIVYCADRMIGALKQLASSLHWREFVLSFLLVAFATSAPEFFIGISSSLLGNQNLSLGNVFGANIINATFIIGIAAIFSKKLRLPGNIEFREIIIVGLISILPTILLLDGSLSRVDGVILLAISMLYILFIFEKRLEHRKRLDSTPRSQILKYLFLLVFWTSLLIVFSRLTVWQAAIFAKETNLNLFIVGLLIISLGTTLPEFIFFIRSASKDSDGFIYGNLFGTLIVNSGLVLGLVAILSPFAVINKKAVIYSGLMLFFSICLLIAFIRSGKKITWQEGLVLIGVFAASAAGQYFIR